REVTVEAKNPGSSSAPQGLSSASAPPRKAVSSPTSISALALGQRLVHHLGEHLGGLRADGRSAADDEGGGGHRAELDALLGVLGDRGLDSLGVHAGLELLGVQTELLGERDQGLLVEIAGGADLAVLEEPCVVLGMLALHRRREARAGGALGVLAVDVHVPVLDPQLAALDVLPQLRQRLVGPLRAVRALVARE